MTDPADTAAPPVDPRYTLANERTLLAWTRTALAFVAAGLALVQLLDELAFPGARRATAVGLVALGGGLALASGWQWQRREAAIRRGEPLGRSWLPWLAAAAVAVAGVVALAVVLAGTVDP